MKHGLSLRHNAEIKNHGTAVLGEVLGTAMFLFIAEGAAKTANLARTASQTQTNAPLDSTSIQMIATAFGLSLLVCAWMFYRVTGGLFNPAITVALWLTGVLTSTRALLLFAAQLLGGIIASALVFGLTPGASSGDAAAAIDVVNTTVSEQITYQQAFLLEMLGTSFLVFSVLMLAVEKHRATYLAPVGIGLTLFVIHLFLVAWTGCSLNPARSLGPAAVGAKFPENHWIYWIGPIVGGILAVIYFHILKALNYNSAVLDQDSDHETSGLRPVHMRLYKRLAGHKDWEREVPQGKQHRKLRFAPKKWVIHRHKIVNDDGTTSFYEAPVQVAHHERSEHDVDMDRPMTAEHVDTINEKERIEDGGLPAPVTSGYRAGNPSQSSDGTIA